MRTLPSSSRETWADLLAHDHRAHVLLAGGPRPRRGLEVRGDADAQVPALAPGVSLASPEARPVDDARRLLDLLLGGDGEERLTGEHGERRFVPLDVVAATDVERIEVELPRDGVEEALAEEVTGRPRAPVRHVGRLVAEHREVLRGDALDAGRALERRRSGSRRRSHR